MSASWAYAIAPAIIAAIVIAVLRRAGWSARLADYPNERSLHSRPTPRLGGLGVVAAALPFVALAGDPSLVAIAACAVFVAVVSFIDDLRSLPIEVRLPAHAMAALIAVLVVGALSPWGWWETAVAVLAVAWMANLYNFMDGSDGLAGGMALIGFAALALAAHRAGQASLALAATAIASAAAGFLLHNLPPARVFLGDCGSVPLGFLAGALGAYGIASGAWPAWFPLLVFSPFIVDATLTLARRALRRERIWKAHRSHYYQRLVLSGWTRTRLLRWSYALMLGAAASASWALRQGGEMQCAILLAWFSIYLSLLVAIERRIGRSNAAS